MIELFFSPETSESASKEAIAKNIQNEETKTWQDVGIKIETETETEADHQQVKKDGAESSPKVETEDTQSTEADMDKFEPIESDEDDEMCGRLDIKTEIDYSLEGDTCKEPVTEDLKSQDDLETACKFAVTKAANEDFDMDDAKPQHEKLDKDASLIESVLPKNEIEDIQQKLHSFHSENLMILQSRNKKRASRATTPTSLDETSNLNVTPKEPSSSEKSRKFSADGRDCKREPSTKAQNDGDSYKQYQSVSNMPQNTATINPSMNATHSYSSYSFNSGHRIDANPSIPPPSQVYPPAVAAAAQTYANINSPLSSNIAASNPMYHYLEPPNRPPSFNAGYNAPPPPMFAIHTNVPPPTLLNSSNYLTKNYSTLSEPSTPVSTSVPTPSLTSVIPSPSNTPMNPKVLQRTQSADPRLNPPKDLPAVTPKRKLSINEYRKRKQLTTSSEKRTVDSSEKTESPVVPIKLALVEDKSNGDTTKETGKLIELFEGKPVCNIIFQSISVFSPAPTLLEMQQESLSRRLKSYKSIHGLSSQIESVKQSTDPTLENGWFDFALS